MMKSKIAGSLALAAALAAMTASVAFAEESPAAVSPEVSAQTHLSRTLTISEVEPDEQVYARMETLRLQADPDGAQYFLTDSGEKVYFTALQSAQTAPENVEFTIVTAK